MDRKVSEEIIRKRKIRFYLKLGIIGIVFIVFFIILVNVLKASVSYNDIIVSEVDEGALNISVSATGTVVPLYEEVVISPVASKILSIYKKTGEEVSEGEPILELDLVAFSADMEKLNDELLMKESRLQQEIVSAESKLADLEMQIKIDEMKLRRMEVLLKNEMFLDSIGASTSDKIKQAELDFQVQTLQLEQLKLKYQNQKQTSDADIKVLELEYKIAKKNVEVGQKTMGEAEVRSPGNAVLTWVNDRIGGNINAGDQLAIVSDLQNFKIEGEISDSYANKISPGNRVEVKIGSKKLMGIVGNVVPSVSDGLIEFNVMLDESDNAELRSGLKVDLYVINSIKENALRIDNRFSYYRGSGEYELWVINGDKAKKRNIVLGESSFDKVEVLDGLKVGEQVIISDMGKYDNREQLRIK